MIEQGVLREQRALNTIRVFGKPGSKSLATIDDLKSNLKRNGTQLVGDLERYYRQIRGGPPAPVNLSAEESAAMKKVPRNVASIKDYFDNRNQVRFRHNLHGLMRDEVFNFVDGQRSYYDIYKAVYAEAAAAGSWYYGTVTLQDVVGLLDAAVQAKALTLK